MTITRAIVLVGFLVALGGSALPAQGTQADNFGFLLAERTALGGANAGIMYRYLRADGVGVDLFVTPLPPSLDPCREACADSALAILSAEFAQAVVDAGGPDSLRLAGSTVVTPPQGSWLERGRLTAIHAYADSSGIDSYLWLYLGQETLVQVRGPHPAGGITFATLNQVVSTLVVSVPPIYDCPDGLSDVPAQVRLVPLDFQMTRLQGLVDSTLLALGYSFVYRDSTHGRWRTAPRYTWPDSSAVARAARWGRPGIELVTVVALDEGHSLLAMSARPVCRVPPVSRQSYGTSAALAEAAMTYALDAILDAIGFLR